MDNKLTVKNFNQSEINLIKDTVAKGATDVELKLFLYTAKQTGLDPLTRQIHFVKRKTRQADGSFRDQMTVQTGIDGYRAIAERTGQLAGIDDAIFDTEQEINPNKASVTVYRLINGERVPFTASARWSEYAQQFVKDGKKILGQMWAKMPYLMLAKCAEALALRKAFPNDLSGLYTNEEMSQADIQPEIVKPNEQVKNESEFTEGLDNTIEGEVVEVEQDKTCTKCGIAHTGKYALCYSCWSKDNYSKKQ